MKTYSSDLWDNIFEPETFVELIDLILKKFKPGLNVRFWRGQANISWKLQPSIVRKIQLDANRKNIKCKELDKSILYWENILLNEAKKNLHHYDERGRKLGDIELLAKLQHYGAATRLLDFSKNVLIALWFCVSDREYKDKTGLLLGIDTDIVSGMENKFDFDESYNHFVDSVCESNNIWLVDSPANVSRISSQHSVFLCSKSVNKKHGTFLVPEEDKYKIVIAISPELKEECLAVLSQQFNITPFTIYPDIEGFANANSSKWELAAFTRW